MKKIKYYGIIFIVLLFIGLSISVLLYKENTIEVDDYTVYIECINEKFISSGAGFVYKESNDKNYIITNYHVIDGYEDIYVYNSDKEKIKATVLNKDEYTDLAILMVDDKLDLDSAVIGDSDNIDIGDKIYTLGNPIDINKLFKIESGTIANLNKEITVDATDFKSIEVNSKVDSGNSGSPLLNNKGKVIGVIFVKEENTNIAYAMPINYVMEIIKKLETNELNRPNLGAVMTNTTNIELMIEYGINEVNVGGVILLEVYESYNYGFQKGDIITKFNNKNINNVNELRKELYQFQKGDNVQVDYNRNNMSYRINIKLQ